MILHPTTSSSVILLQIIVIHTSQGEFRNIQIQSKCAGQSIIQISLGVVVFLWSLRCVREVVSADFCETLCFIPLSSGRGFAKRSPFSLASIVQQASRSRSHWWWGKLLLWPHVGLLGEYLPKQRVQHAPPNSFQFVCPEFDGLSLWKLWSFPGAFDVHVAVLSETFASCRLHNLIKPEFYAVFIYILVWVAGIAHVWERNNIWAHPEIAQAGWSKLLCIRGDSWLPILLPMQ